MSNSNVEFRTARTPHGFSLPAPSTKPTLNDRAAYNKSLAQSLGSKLFFVGHVPMHKVGLVVDFGCADGALLKSLRHLTAPGAHLIGIDREVSQCEAARANFPEATGFYTSMEWAENEIANAHVTRDLFCGERCSLLVLSSVLHEVLTEDGDIMNFWRGVERLGFDYVAIRDMAVPDIYRLRYSPNAWLVGLLSDRQLHQRRVDFSLAWGEPNNLQTLVHFLLKYPYEANWERELSENYLPYCVEDIEYYTTQSGMYHVAHSERTTTKHFKERVMRDLGIDTGDLTTHLELVLKRTERR